MVLFKSRRVHFHHKTPSPPLKIRWPDLKMCPLNFQILETPRPLLRPEKYNPLFKGGFELWSCKLACFAGQHDYNQMDSSTRCKGRTFFKVKYLTPEGNICHILHLANLKDTQESEKLNLLVHQYKLMFSATKICKNDNNMKFTAYYYSWKYVFKI